MQDIPNKIDSKFRFALLAAYRAEQLIRGAQAKVNAENRKVTRVAMDEIAKDLISWDYGPEDLPDEPEPFDALVGEGAAQESD